MAGLAVNLAFITYLLAIVLLVLGMEFLGERAWPLAVGLYLPQTLFLLPLAILIPAALLAEAPGWTWILFAITVIIFVWHLSPGIGWKHSPSSQVMRVMTNNYAQNHGLSLASWIGAEDPDILALEDASGQGPVFQREYPERYVMAADQFILMSKTPIRNAALLPVTFWRDRPTAAVFDVDFHGQEVAVYTVHMPSPRSDFAKLGGLGLLREILGRNRRRSDGWSFQEAMTNRVSLARSMAQFISVEKRPYIVMGDFNMPSNGYVHRIFASRFTDAFAQTGWGFGYTFPGDANNPLSFFQPWLRIDYVFAGRGWQVDSCKVEPRRRSKHRPVSAILSPV